MISKIISYIEEYALAFMMFLMAGLSFLQVILRYGFGSSLIWIEEFNRFLMVYTTFFGAALGIKYHRHIRVEFLVAQFSKQGWRGAELFVNLVGTLYSLVITWLSFRVALQIGDFGQVSASLQIPMVLPYLFIPTAGAIMFMRYGYQFIIGIMGYWRTRGAGGEAHFQ